MNVSIVAFGFKHGIPLDAELLLDVRFLRNPNYEPALEPKTGADPAVAAFIEEDPSLAPFLAQLFPFVDLLLAQYDRTGRRSLHVAIGCTGGRHRSVYVARRLAEHLRGAARYTVALHARDAETP